MTPRIRGTINRVSIELGIVTIGGTLYLATPPTAATAYDWVGREVTARVVGRIVDQIELTDEEKEKEGVDGQAGESECDAAGEGEI